MSMRYFELDARQRKPTPVRGRDLAAAWLTAAAVVASLALLPAVHGSGNAFRDPALAAGATRSDCHVPDGIGGVRHGFAMCSARPWADQRC